MKLNLSRIFGTRKFDKIGYLSAKNEVKEAFKGEVSDTEVRFPVTLGAEHPFDFEAMENVYKTIGVVTGGVNKITDSVVGDFSIKTKTKKGERIIKDFIKNTSFTSVLREWIREGFSKGNGFLELDIEGMKIKVLNANDMYVKRDDKANVKEYRQWVGSYKGYTIKSPKLITFKPNQIAHLKINKIAGEPYGLGIIHQNEIAIENMVLNEQDLQKIISRKAGAPLHVQVGKDDETVDTKYVDEVKVNLQVMNNRTEWVTDNNVKMNVIDFGEIGKNLIDALDHNMLVVAYGMEIPIVLFGGGNIPEGLAKAQKEMFQRKMSVIQEEIESIIEEQIFKPLLEQHGSNDEVEFIWNLPGEEEINNRIDKLSKLLGNNVSTSEPLRRIIELEISRLLDLEDAHNYLPKPEKENPEDKEPEPTQPEPKKDDEEDEDTK